MQKKLHTISQNKIRYHWYFGSATPSIETYYKVQKENGVLTLKERANSAKLPKVEVIDMKNELAIRKQIYVKLQII